MSGRTEDYVRVEGAAMRQNISRVALSHGSEIALLVAKRVVWELADLIGETHGPTVVHEMLGEAKAGFQLDMAPPIKLDRGPDTIELLVNAVEGLSTITNQNREVIVTLASAIGALADEVRRGR
jgi:hypothetical protein